MISCKVAPLGRFSRSKICAVLLPARAGVAFFARLARLPDLTFLPPWRTVAAFLWRFGAFLPGLALSADLPLVGATWAFCAARVAFLAGFGSTAAPVA